VKGLTQLNAHHKADLLQVLQENKKMFNGTLGVYPHKKICIDIDPNAKPVHSRSYSLPQIHLKTFKMELNHLVKIGVLAPQQESKWASLSFFTPKKDDRVCWISSKKSTEQSHLMQPISVANNHGHFAQAYWVQVFHKT
jgi:hypothetical protein